MCYASPVMLRGRCAYTISGRPGTPSGTQKACPTPSPGPKYPLSPIIPVHPRDSPVSPIIPVHTQKQGGGALLFNFQLGIRRRMPILSEPAVAGEPKDLLGSSPSSLCSPPATRLPAAASAEEGHSPLSPLFPLHRRHSRVSPIISTHTQNIGGGGGYLSGNVLKICRRADILPSARGRQILRPAEQQGDGEIPPPRRSTRGAQVALATRRARLRRGRENRVAPLGMTAKRGKRKAAECQGQGIVRTRGAGVLRPYTSGRNPRAARLRRTGPTTARGRRARHVVPLREEENPRNRPREAGSATT
jgi:hypothetical protein